MNEHEMRTVANTIAAVGLTWNPAGRKPADMYRAMADRLADAGLLQSPETAAEHEAVRTERNTAVSTVAEQAHRLAKREREHNADRAELETLRKRVAELEARPSRAEVLREFAARVDEMREEGDPSVWLPAWEAVGEVIDEARRLAAEAAYGEPELVVFRASHDSIPMGLYTTAAEARKHCETEVRREWPNARLDWVEDEDGVADLYADADSNFDRPPTGYVVSALTVASAYDEEADE